MENVILQPIEVGGQTFKNRIMFPPLTTGYEKNGMISEQDMGFYTRLAKGGVGYIVMGDVAPINSFSPTPKLFDDSQIPAFKALADSVHAYGTKLGIQIFHPEYDVDAINSLFMQKKFDEMRQRLHHDMMFFTDEASEEMLMSIIDKMCACAVRAQKAGVDVIQIHGDRLNGCLCSTRMNHRTDKFGGSLENRVRFARMLTRAIRKAVPDMVIDYKLSIVTPQRGKGGIDEAALLGNDPEQRVCNQIKFGTEMLEHRRTYTEVHCQQGFSLDEIRRIFYRAVQRRAVSQYQQLIRIAERRR